MKDKTIRQLGKKAIGSWVCTILFGALTVYGTVFYINKGDVGRTILFALVGLLTLLLIYTLLRGQITFKENNFTMPRSLYNPSGADVKYEDIVSVELLTKTSDGNLLRNDGIGRKIATIEIRDRYNKSYRLPTGFFSKKQVQFIVGEARTRAKLKNL